MKKLTDWLNEALQCSPDEWKDKSNQKAHRKILDILSEYENIATYENQHQGY